MNDLPMDFYLAAAIRMRELAGSSDLPLRMLAVNLDLPMDDAESVDFLRQALNITSQQMREQMYRERADRIANGESA